MYLYQRLLSFLVILIVASTIILPHRSVNLKTLNFELGSEQLIQYGNFLIQNLEAPLQITGRFYNKNVDQYPYTLKLSQSGEPNFNEGDLINGYLQNPVKLILRSNGQQFECIFESANDVCTIQNPQSQFVSTRIQCENIQQKSNNFCTGQLFIKQNLSESEHKSFLHRQQNSSKLPLKDQLRQIIDKNVKMFDQANKKSGKNVKLDIQKNKVSISGENITKFDWNWELIKESYPLENSENIKDFFQLRKRTVDQLLQKIFSQFSDCKLKQEKQEVNVCKATSSGSVGASANYLSDYDLTVTGNFKVSQMIDLFNTAILEYFGSYPFQAFDSNLYGYSFMFPLTQGFKHNITWPLDNVQRLYNYLNNPINQKFVQQDIWAYNRLQNFKENDHSDHRITFSCQKCNNWISANNLSTIDTKSKSQKYLQRMKVFQKLMEKYPDNVVKSYPSHKILSIKKEMIEALSHMNYFGDATYFTQGTFAHVVGTMFYYKDKQGCQKTALVSKRHLIHSLIQNLAYFIHAYQDKDIEYAIKYLQRFLDALILIQQIDGNNDNTVTALKKLQSLSGLIKSKVRNLSNKQMFDKLKTTPQYKDKLSKIKDPYEANNDNEKIMNDLRKEITKDFQTQFNNYTKSKGLQTDKDNNYVYGMVRLIKKVIDQNPQMTDLRINQKENKFDFKIKAFQSGKDKKHAKQEKVHQLFLRTNDE